MSDHYGIAGSVSSLKPLSKTKQGLINSIISLYIYIYIYIYSGSHNVQTSIVSSERVGITFYLNCFRFYDFHRQ